VIMRACVRAWWWPSILLFSNPTPLNVAYTVDYISTSTIRSSFR
jgi:hypothetical protein